MSIVTNYKVNLLDLSNVFLPLTSSSYTLIPSSSGLPNQLFYTKCSINSNGSIMVIGVTPLFGTSPLYISTNSGVTWTTAPGVSNSIWWSTSCSPSGQYIVAGAQSGAIWASSNYGSTWSLLPALPSNPTGGVPVNYGTPGEIQSLSINNAGLLLVSAQYSNSLSRELLFYSNNLSAWNLQQLQGYSNIALYIQECKISNNSTNIFTPQFMCCVTQYFSGYTGGIWIYTISNPFWTNYGSITGVYQSIDISNDGQYGVVSFASSVSSPVYLSSNYGQTWTISSSPVTSANVCMSSTGSVICFNNFIVSFNYGISWITLPAIPYNPGQVSLAANGTKALLVSISSSTVTTGCYIYTLSQINQNTNYLVNGTDLSSLFNPQPTNPGTSYMVTNYKVSNFIPLWTTVSGTYDLGQIFDNIPPTYLLTGNYTVYNNNGYTGIVFEYPSGTIKFSRNFTANLLLVGGGGGGGGGAGFTTPQHSGGGGGGIYLNNNFQTDTNTYNITVGKGGSGAIYTPLTQQTPGGNTTISNGITNYFANGGGISFGPSSTVSYGGIGGNSSDGFSTGGNGGNWYPFTTDGSNSTYISTILPFTSSPTTLYLSGGGGAGVYGLIPTSNYSGYAGKGIGGLTGAYPYPANNYNGQSATQSISSGGYGGGGGSAATYYTGNGGNGGNGVVIMWWITNP